MTRHLSPSDYAHLIDLGTPFDRANAAPGDETTSALVAAVASWLIEESGRAAGDLPASDADRRKLITRVLTVRPPRPIPADALAMLDRLFAAEARARAVVSVGDIVALARPPLELSGTAVHLWRGDITTLVVDAIVNAANADLLGCFRPGHACIDNAIHTIAGPRLREDCQRIVTRQGHAEPTGTSKVTRAYHLPSTFVLHTVGPIVPTGMSASPAQQRLLADCYSSCLDVAASVSARSIAFCAISTGVFGYPKVEAAQVALETVRDWTARHPGVVDHIVFDVFSEADEDVYRRVGGFE